MQYRKIDGGHCGHVGPLLIAHRFLSALAGPPRDDAHVQLDAQRRRPTQLPVVVRNDERFVLVVQVRPVHALPAASVSAHQHAAERTAAAAAANTGAA